MKDLIRKKYVIVTTVLVVIISAGLVLLPGTHRVVYNTEVKPILNKKCISCHGGVKQQGGFSLLFREEALKVTKNGNRAIVPGDPDASEMIRRLTLKDEEERMPYKKHPLPDEEIDLLRQWISEGAEWGTHWAYLPVKEPELPIDKGSFFGLIKAENPEWIINEIDYFIYDRLKAENLTPASE
ncbi:MAG: c-type cytochrome domain-containing protein, partial [Flavitalea sp.]